MSNIKLNESDIEKVVRMIIFEGYDESLPISWGRTEDVVIKRQMFEQVVGDLFKASSYFSELQPKNDPIYSDKLGKLNRALKVLNKIGR